MPGRPVSGRLRPGAILTDIEGTTTPIAFVHDVLFPYGRARLPAFIARHESEPAVVEALTQVREAAPGEPPLNTLLAWMDADAKATPLKALQGMVWNEGYQAGDLKGRLYADVAPALRRWHAAGIGLYVYSSGSEAAQRLIFGHSEAGDLSGLFGGFFDTRVGAKREADSYRRIARAVGLAAGDMLFLSDVEAELDAARVAGLSTCQLARPEDGTIRSRLHDCAASFDEVTAMYG